MELTSAFGCGINVISEIKRGKQDQNLAKQIILK